ncbi:MAG: ABC transporter permease [Cyanobacteria bacterium REEB67]|nr:ABC transporter permease [Cyanobacteria bacterium REEB67]
MLSLIVRRMLSAIPMLFLLSLVSFFLIRALPGDPVDVMLGSAQKEIPPEQLLMLRHEYGLDQNPARQYLLWLKGWIYRPSPGNVKKNLISQNALGLSYRDGRPVRTVILERVPATLALVGIALIISFSAGLALGAVIAALSLVAEREGGSLARLAAAAEGTIVMATLAVYSAPNFWMAFMAIALIANNSLLAALPVLGLHAPGESASPLAVIGHLLLPALLLSARRTAKIALFIRSLALDELSREYVLSALAKGLSLSQVVCRHVLANCLLPVVNLAGLSLPGLISGSVLIETVFCLPGMGRLMFESTLGRNYPVLMGLFMLYGTVVVCSTLLADMASIALDPRLREGNQ